MYFNLVKFYFLLSLFLLLIKNFQKKKGLNINLINIDIDVERAFLYD